MVLIWNGEGNGLGAARVRGAPRPVAPADGAAPPPMERDLSHRQRKQVYMHSTIFEPASAAQPPRSAAARQAASMEAVSRRICASPRAPTDVAMPGARDLRVTDSAGHSVITWGRPEAGGAPDFVKWGEKGDAIQVVHARREAPVKPSPPAAATRASSASDRRLHEHSSELFGSQRRLEKSTSTPSRDLRPVSLQAYLATDSLIDREPGRRPAPRPASARERRIDAMGASVGSQFAVHRREAAAQDMSGARADELRRKSERNYSDLFGAPSPRAAAAPQGEEGVIYRPHRSAVVSRAARTSAEAEAERVAPLTPRTRPWAMDPAQRQADGAERSWFDSQHGMNAVSEVARRQRDRSAWRDTPTDRSASARRRAEFASQGLRTGMGAPARAEDPAAAPPPAPGSGLNTPRRLAGLTPRADQVRPGSARARKMTLMSSTGIF